MGEPAKKKGPGAGTKYELLLATASNRTCYKPDCPEPLLVERDGNTITNFEFAHIRDELPPNSEDFGPGMALLADDLTQRERNHFSNLILLCTPCHRLIDKLDPRAFDVPTLQGWKALVEEEGTVELANSLGVVSAVEVEAALLEVLRTFDPNRHGESRTTSGGLRTIRFDNVRAEGA